MKLVRFWTVLAAAFVLAACAARIENPQPITAADRAIAIEHIKESFFDPFSIRDAWIAPGTGAAIAPQKGRPICLRMNAKNRMGGYTGRRVSAFFIHEGRIHQSILAAHGPDHCTGARWQPFPEAEALK